MSGFSGEVRRLGRARSGPLCERCGNYHSALQDHHRLPRKCGGTRREFVNRVSNLLVLCPPCHSVTEHNRTEAYESGWLVHDYPMTPPPSQVPVLRRGRLVLLGDDGSVTPLPRSGAWGGTPAWGEGLDDGWPLGQVTF